MDKKKKWIKKKTTTTTITFAIKKNYLWNNRSESLEVSLSVTQIVLSVGYFAIARSDP